MSITKKLIAGSAVAATFFGVSPAFADTVTVHTGDSLWSIAQAHQTSVQSLMNANPNVSANNLQVGSTLQLPQLSQATTYMVKSGDSLWSIAKNFNVSLSGLEQANPSITPTNLVIGTTLNIPSNSVTTTATAVTSTGDASATGTVGQQNLYWLEHVISAEANAEPLDAQIAVGDVVLHRLESGQDGSTIKDVVFQVSNGHYQFTCVANDFIYNAPTASSIQAATQVLDAQQDVVPGALVFFNPAQTPSNSWVWTQPQVAQIGHFIFAK